jgi:hypothetical protein
MILTYPCSISTESEWSTPGTLRCEVLKNFTPEATAIPIQQQFVTVIGFCSYNQRFSVTDTSETDPL